MDQSRLHQHKGVRLGAGFLGLLLLVGCSRGPQFPFEKLLSTEDLPAGWYDAGGSLADQGDAPGRWREFALDRKREWLSIKQLLVIYATEADAQAAYAPLEQTWFPTSDWVTPSDFTYLPQDTSDLFRFSCAPFEINFIPVLSCTALQQHRTYLSLLIANIYEPALSLGQFEAAVESMGLRLSIATPP